MKKLLTSAAFALTALAGPAFAEYPTGPVQFIVPWPPGDFEDILTRMIAADMAEATGQPASVVNRPGGGDGPFPGALEVLEAPSDGSVIGSFVIGVPVVGPKIGIGIEEDSFVPIGIFLTYPFVLAASGDAPYSNMAELADYAKEKESWYAKLRLSVAQGNTDWSTTRFARKYDKFDIASKRRDDAFIIGGRQLSKMFAFTNLFL